MDRAELEALDRDGLIRRAEEAGVARPSILTRPELVDELLLRSAPRPGDPTLRRVRGFFGIARDLLASVIDRGLHLPDAADRIRSLRGPEEEVAPRKPPAVLPTVTLAEIYAAQGHRARAVDTLERVLDREPDHAAARALIAQLKDESYSVPAPPLPPETEEEAASALADLEPPDLEPQDEAGESDGMGEAATVFASPQLEPLDELGEAATIFATPEAVPNGQANDHANDLANDEAGGAATIFAAPPIAEVATAARWGADHCVAIAVDPTTLLVTWELSSRARERAKRFGDGALVLSVFVVVPTWDRPQTSTRELAVGAVDHCTLSDLPRGAVTRAAIGVRGGAGFIPLAHSAALEVTRVAHGPLEASDVQRWTPAGAAPVRDEDADAAAIRRALEHPVLANGARRSTNAHGVATRAV